MTSHGAQRTAQSVVDVCRGVVPQVPTAPAQVTELVEALRHHRVAPLAHVLLRETEPDTAEGLKPDRDTAVGVHIRATIALEDLGRALGDIPWATFKGPVLSELAHPAPGLRTYNDIDVLVDGRTLREVTTRLLAAGWSVADYNDMLHNPRTPGEMHWVSPTGLLVDLHWSMINMAERRRRFTVASDELLARRVPVTLGLTQAYTLEHADALTHVCLHAALTGANRMLLLLDADQLARQAPDWLEVAARARAWRAEPYVAVVLRRAHTLLGTPLPEDLDRMLGTSAAFHLVTGAADRLAPVSSLRREASVARLVSRAARHGAGRTLAAVGHNSLLGVRNRLFHLGGTGAPPVRERADAEALEAYLCAVEAETAGAS